MRNAHDGFDSVIGPRGAVGFLESDYFTSRIAPDLPEERMNARLSMLVETGQASVLESMSVGHLLTTDLGRLSVTFAAPATTWALVARMPSATTKAVPTT